VQDTNAYAVLSPANWEGYREPPPPPDPAPGAITLGDELVRPLARLGRMLFGTKIYVARLAHRCPLCWYRPLPWQSQKERTVSGPAEMPSDRRLTGRHHPGFAGDFPGNRTQTGSHLLESGH
jgi:hypothetical protein